MGRILAIVLSFLLSVTAAADANNGEYLGFKLGEKFKVPRGSFAEDHIIGALIYTVDPHPRHQHIGSLSVYVSPKSSIIGSIFGGWYFSNKQSAQVFADRYSRTLEEKYDHWKHRRGSFTNGDYQLFVDLEQRSPIGDDHWPSNKKFRVSVALIFAPDSVPRKDWMETIKKEADY